MRRRSNLLVLIGLAAFVLGLVAVYLITGDDDDDGGGGDSDTVTVLVASEDLSAGALGEDVIREQRYREERVSVSDRQPDAVIAPSQLSSSVLTLNFAEGEQLRTSGLRSLGGPRAEIPEGFEAVSITVPFVAGGANTIQPSDRVNVFTVFPSERTSAANDADGVAEPLPFRTPRTELLLTNTLVLDVQLGTAPLQVSQPPETGAAAPSRANTLVMVLAVDTLDAEKLIFANSTSGSQLYLSRVRLDGDGNPTPPVESTPGVDFGNILAEEAGVAFRRSNG